jgi:ABC-type Fe3+-hydroxamate transport system substrate-binding protein
MLFAFVLPISADAEINVVDDMGRTITLAQPAKRIISLSPHVTELLYAAGAGQQVVSAIIHLRHKSCHVLAVTTNSIWKPLCH